MLRRPSLLTRAIWRRRLRVAAATLLLAGLTLAAWFWQPVPMASVPFVQVIDGDSLAVRSDDARLTIRLSGVDAVEYRQLCTRAGKDWPCGWHARSALERLAEGGPLLCALSAKDRYGRTLATCRTAPVPNGLDLGGEMVRLGWAVAIGDSYIAEEWEARVARRGIWQGGFATPADWRAAQGRPAAALASPDM